MLSVMLAPGGRTLWEKQGELTGAFYEKKEALKDIIQMTALQLQKIKVRTPRGKKTLWRGVYRSKVLTERGRQADA